ncbi:hypothetical protein GLYMA_20G137200v4 [Glycine max]|uniref:cysteine-rich receptor-like protein kinase 10 n=1 Tax=Glycine max TaxID=3847 RepID=UPI000233E06A|nr:cysteine-rich receptor-like protein kinase 10 [Glycine max]KRG91158.2 hypothetical protein GLYMA_20G137200v4 [Glycine max]|eukprot:XP_025983326.1 cysteine-rich receptor-like protein kinase 10 [Glycine max]
MAVLPLRSLSFVCCLLIIANFISQASADYAQNFTYFCDPSNRGNYTTDSTYDANLDTLLSTLTSNTEINYGFYNSSYGENTDKVYAIGLCRGDVKPDECSSCLNVYRTIRTELCPNRKEAIGWYEDEKCMLRYSDHSIFDHMEMGPAFFYHNMYNATDLDQFNKSLNTLLGNLKSEAASGDSRLKYAVGNIPGPDNKVIYGLVQCTPDLLQSECAQCLKLSIESIPRDCCKDKIGGRAVRPSCNMRFETASLFYGDTAYAPSPSPSPSRSQSLLPPSSTVTHNTSSGGKSSTATISIAVAVPVVAAVVFIFIYMYLRGRKRREKFKTQQEEEYDDEIDISKSLQFNFNTIRDATNDFCDSNKLGKGGFGIVYRGRLSNGQEIAVKRLSTNSRQGDIEFKNEVLLVAKLQHRNLVRLLGFCLERREKLLVYEFVPNKSLDYFIFDQAKRPQLDWEKRYKIIEGVARGILYLHQDSRLRIIHRDLKASNILLDEEMNPKISDFGLAKLFGVNQTHGDTNRIVGTYGYMAPEYAMHGQFSEKSDIFSFGVLVLEVVSGQKNSCIRHGDFVEDLLSFAWQSWTEGRATNIIDPTLNNGSQNEIMRCIHIGLLCVQDNVAARPTTLPLPLEPAFYVDRTGDLPDMQLWEFSSRTTRSREDTTRSVQESVNEASISDPYPR